MSDSGEEDSILNAERSNNDNNNNNYDNDYDNSNINTTNNNDDDDDDDDVQFVEHKLLQIVVAIPFFWTC